MNKMFLILLFVLVAGSVCLVSFNFFDSSISSCSDNNFLNFCDYKTVSETESIPFEKSIVSDDTLEYGKSRVLSNGSEGIKVVEYSIVYKGGKEISKTRLSEKITKQPTSKVIAIGTKIIWRCYDTTSYDKNPYNDNECVSSTGESISVTDSIAISLDPNYTPSKKGHPYYNSF